MIVRLSARARSPIRWTVLGLSALSIVGPYWALDSPAATAGMLREYMGVPLHLDGNSSAATNQSVIDFGADYGFLYTTYSIPNMVMPLFGGVLLDFFGIRRVMVVLSVISTAGHFFFAFGAAAKSWTTMWLGRVVFGLGTESLIVAQTAMVASWFAGGEVALGLSAIVSIARFAIFINDNVSALFDDVRLAYWMGGLICLLSTAANVILSLVDARFECQTRERRERRAAARRARARSRGFSSSDPVGVGEAPTAGTETPYLVTPKPPPKPLLEQIRSFRLLSKSFWLLTVYCVVFWATISSFSMIATSYLDDRWTREGLPHTLQKQNFTLSLVFLTTAIVAPLAGFFIDWVGLRSPFMIGSGGVVLFAHATLSIPFLMDLFPAQLSFIILGFGFGTFAAAFWPSVALFAPATVLGAAYGATSAVQNTGLGMMPLIVAQIQPPACDNAFWCVSLFLMAFSVLGIAIGIVILRLERHRKVELKALHDLNPHGSSDEEGGGPSAPPAPVGEGAGVIRAGAILATTHPTYPTHPTNPTHLHPRWTHTESDAGVPTGDESGGIPRSVRFAADPAATSAPPIVPAAILLTTVPDVSDGDEDRVRVGASAGLGSIGGSEGADAYSGAEPVRRHLSGPAGLGLRVFVPGRRGDTAELLDGAEEGRAAQLVTTLTEESLVPAHSATLSAPGRGDLPAGLRSPIL